MTTTGTGLAILAAAVLAAVVAGVLHRRSQGRGRAVTGAGADVVDLRVLPEPPGERATLLQLSSPACAPCRAARRVLASVAAAGPGVAHVEVDASRRIDLAERLHVLRTPTVLVLDDTGVVRHRFAGVPAAADVRAVLAGLPAGVIPSTPTGEQ